eukprot:g13255.t2
MIDDVKALVSWGREILEALEGADAVKAKMRARLKDYDGMLQVLLLADGVEDELLKMRGIFEEIVALHTKHTAGSCDPRWVKIAKRVNRATLYKTIEEGLDAVDAEARQLFAVITAKSSIDTRKALKQISQDLESQEKRTTAVSGQVAIAGGVSGALLLVIVAAMLSHRKVKSSVGVGDLAELFQPSVELAGEQASASSQLTIVEGLAALLVVCSVVMCTRTRVVSTMIRGVQPRAFPELAPVPAGALALPRSYVKRPALEEAVVDLISPEKALDPYTVVGMGGAGKSVLASAIVRDSRVRQRFRGGVFWLRVGRGASGRLLPLLEGLAREMGWAPSDVPNVEPHAFDGLEQVKAAIIAGAAGSPPRLVVLDDVWGCEDVDDVWGCKIVDVLLALQVKVLVTTRDHSVVGVLGHRLALGNMSEDEAMELLLKASSSVGQPSDDIRTQMAKVVGLCGCLPLALAIAGSMPVVKGKGLTAAAWEELARLFEGNAAKKGRVKGEQSTSLHVVFEASLDALSGRKQEEMLKTAVLAPGAVAPIEMLLNLWEIEDVKGTREDAEDLSNRCLLEDIGAGRYRVHDLLLEFLKLKLKAEDELVRRATEQQAEHLRRLDVVDGYDSTDHGAGDQGLFFLAALWRSVEKLSGNLELEVNSYRASLAELESTVANENVARSFLRIGQLFSLQGKRAEAKPLFERSEAIREEVLGPEHPDVAVTLNWRAMLCGDEGKYAEAEPLYERAQAILEKALGSEHPDVAILLANRARLMQNRGMYSEAEPLSVRAVEMTEKSRGPDSALLASMLSNRASLLVKQGKYDDAEPLLGKYTEALRVQTRALHVQEKALGPKHPSMAVACNLLASCMVDQARYTEADLLFVRAIAIGEKALGPEHPDLALWLSNRASLLETQGRYDGARHLHERSVAIHEKAFGPDHPGLASLLAALAQLLESQGKHAQAGPLYERSQAIREKVLGPDHPDVAHSLNNRATSLMKQV